MMYLLERMLFRNTMLPNCNEKKIIQTNQNDLFAREDVVQKYNVTQL
jgi:hypothetical protein